ncbi:MAG: OmpA family protein [Planctomycetales bacterium]
MGRFALEGKHFPLNAMIEHMTKLGSHSNQTGRGGVKAKGLPAGENDQPHTRVTRKRDGIAVKDAVIIFTPGKKDLDPQQLEAVAASARRLSGKRHKIEVRGSTSPLKGKAGEGDVNPRMFAYERARRVADRLKQGGVDPERIKLSSVGDHFVSIGDETEAPATTPDCVQILVLDMYAEEFQGERAAGS